MNKEVNKVQGLDGDGKITGDNKGLISHRNPAVTTHLERVPRENMISNQVIITNQRHPNDVGNTKINSDTLWGPSGVSGPPEGWYQGERIRQTRDIRPQVWICSPSFRNPNQAV